MLQICHKESNLWENYKKSTKYCYFKEIRLWFKENWKYLMEKCKGKDIIVNFIETTITGKTRNEKTRSA